MSNVARNYAHEVLNRSTQRGVEPLDWEEYSLVVEDFDHMYEDEGHTSVTDAWVVYYDRIGGWNNFKSYARALVAGAHRNQR